jgi:hypothetical protein
MKGFHTLNEPGCPQLPSKTYLVCLPPATKVTNVELIDEQYVSLVGAYEIKPYLPKIQNGLNIVSTEINQDVYTSNNPYPSKTYRYNGMGQLRKYIFAKIQFNPIQYCPIDGKLTVYSPITLKISYNRKEPLSNELISDTLFDKYVSSKLVNYEKMKSYYTASLKNSNNGYDYVIIINESVASAVTNLKQWKETVGYQVNIVNTSDIYLTYTGEDKPEKIRNFLIDKYAEWGIKYVLIIGSHNSLPMRYCYPDPQNHDGGNWKIPTDHYYADLTGDWDADGDGFYGERRDDDVDIYQEVYVGRIPFDDYQKIKDICRKTIEFEQDDGTWKTKALLLGAKTFRDGGCSDNFIEILKEDIFEPEGYDCTTMYEKEGWKPSPIPCDYPISKSNVLDIWPNGYGLVTWKAHGNSDSAYRLIWRWFEEEFHSFLKSRDVTELNDDKPSIVYSESCHNARPEDDDNLGFALINHGAVAFIGATRLSWIIWGEDNTFGGALDLDYQFHRNLIIESQSVAESLFNAKLYIDEYGQGIMDINQYPFNLYGDPSLRVAGYENICVRNPDTGEAFTCIQDAIDDVDTKPGHRIEVDAGTYYETLNVHKGVYLKGDSMNKPILDGEKKDEVLALHADDCRISNFIIQNGKNGININNATGTIIFENTIRSNKYGISGSSLSRDNVIFHNSFINNTCHAYDQGNNSWYNVTINKGNYWDDYQEPDLNDDEIGDNSYDISGGNNEDPYPFLREDGWRYIADLWAGRFNIWENIKPGSTIQGNILIANHGEKNSFLDWEIYEWPDWGNWTFTPDHGVDLIPENGTQTVQITVIAPDKTDEYFSGFIKIRNRHNPDDNTKLTTSLSTPKEKVLTFFRLIEQWLSHFLLLIDETTSPIFVLSFGR